MIGFFFLLFFFVAILILKIKVLLFKPSLFEKKNEKKFHKQNKTSPQETIVFIINVIKWKKKLTLFLQTIFTHLRVLHTIPTRFIITLRRMSSISHFIRMHLNNSYALMGLAFEEFYVLRSQKSNEFIWHMEFIRIHQMKFILEFISLKKQLF